MSKTAFTAPMSSPSFPLLESLRLRSTIHGKQRHALASVRLLTIDIAIRNVRDYIVTSSAQRLVIHVNAAPPAKPPPPPPLVKQEKTD